MTVAEIVTDRIVKALEQGVAPWRKPWQTTGVGASRWASNLVSKKAYRGINQMLLQMSGYSSPFWLTFKQAQSLGGSVRKGEKGTPVIYVGSATSKAKKENKKTGELESVDYKFLRYYTVFNVEQCDGLDKHLPKAEVVVENKHERIAAAEALVAGYADAPKLVDGGDRAYYHPARDVVGMPALAQFDSADAFYETLFHEFTHSTGHEARLKRDGIVKLAAFGDESYGKEELIAELGAAFLCADAGLDRIEASAAYCQSWIKVLKGDAKLVISAAAAAQRAYEYIAPKKEVDSAT